MYKKISVSQAHKENIYAELINDDDDSVPFAKSSWEGAIYVLTSSEAQSRPNTVIGSVLMEGQSVYIYDGDINKAIPSIEYTGNLFDVPVYTEVENLIRKGEPALARMTKEGIEVKKNLTLDEFFKYISGEINSSTSQQKKLVMEILAAQGYTMDELKSMITSVEKAKDFLYLHELSHILNKDLEYVNTVGTTSREMLMLEVRATREA